MKHKKPHSWCAWYGQGGFFCGASAWARAGPLPSMPVPVSTELPPAPTQVCERAHSIESTRNRIPGTKSTEIAVSCV
eukprot:1617341-Rhodomonas_salina.1